MKTRANSRDIFLPSLTSILISCMMVFLSCASQNRVKDDLSASAEELQLQETTETEQVVGDNTEANLGLEGADVAQFDETAQQATDQVVDAAATEQAQVSDDLSNLGMSADGSSEVAATSEVPTGTEGTDLAATQGLGDGTTPDASAGALTDTSAVPTDATTGTENVDAAMLGLDETASIGAVATNDSPDAAAQTGTETQSIESTPVLENPSKPIIEDEAPKKSWRGRSHSASWSGHSRVPKIPGQAITKKGTTLNRFYFTRRGDTPAKVSELIYGDTQNAKSLSRWNPGKWAAGSLIFYASPVDPNDKEMHSFYKERNVTSEDYTVGRGDWLSKIADRKLGSSHSWKEIAVINGMTNPNSLEVGQKIAIYPQDLSSFSGQNVARNEAPPQQETVPVAPVQQAAPQVEAPVAQEPITASPIEPAPVEEPKKVATKQNIDGNKFLEQNALAILILGGALVLLLALVMRRKKAARQAEEFGEENFAPPTKIKRK
jgi:hypothetical protein